jgi:hypothetical protein
MDYDTPSDVMHAYDNHGAPLVDVVDALIKQQEEMLAIIARLKHHVHHLRGDTKATEPIATGKPIWTAV